MSQEAERINKENEILHRQYYQNRMKFATPSEPQRIVEDMVDEYQRLTSVGKIYATDGDIHDSERCFFDADQIQKMLMVLGIRLEEQVDSRYLKAYKGKILLLTFDRKGNSAKYNNVDAWRFRP